MVPSIASVIALMGRSMGVGVRMVRLRLDFFFGGKGQVVDGPNGLVDRYDPVVADESGDDLWIMAVPSGRV
jgi:hypothetical protein